MIPKYFRCGDPHQKCPHSVTKELLKDNPAWQCPCSHPNCVDFRDPVPFYVVHKIWLLSIVAIAALVLLFSIIGSNDPCLTKLQDLQLRVETLDKEFMTWSQSSKPSDNSGARQRNDASSLVHATQKIRKGLAEEAERKNQESLRNLKAESKQRLESAKQLLETLDKPQSGSGLVSATLKPLMAKFVALQQDLEFEHENAEAECPQHAADFEALTNQVEASISKIRRMSGGQNHTPSIDENLITTVNRCITELATIHDQIDQLLKEVPEPTKFEAPFEKADLVLGAAPGIIDRLIQPLASAWCNATNVAQADDGKWYVNGVAGKKLLVIPMSVASGFQGLADQAISLYVADQSPTFDELALMGSGFKESRSVAEVIALDALTLLAHPDNPLDAYEFGQSLPLTLAAGEKGSIIRKKVEQFGLSSSRIVSSSGEHAAMSDQNYLACSLYHLEGKNLRAKRFAVQASKDSPALKPSAFTIATEEYLFSYRIVAWTAQKPNQMALDFVKFTTSDDGQLIVKKSGFIDLRLVGDASQAEPAKLAALGEAIGSKTISDARRLSTNIRFEVNEAKLDLKAQADLERITRTAASDYPKHTVVILGFTDNSGGPAVNQPLSIKRAESVATELRRSKVETKSNGLGDSFPIDSNETEAGKARNRRAEVWVVKP